MIHTLLRIDFFDALFYHFLDTAKYFSRALFDANYVVMSEHDVEKCIELYVVSMESLLVFGALFAHF